ncbi:MAG: bacteriocin [Bacteroidales bacterium]|nr:bacteriocin [Bacteroidales bacterium]
MKTNLFKKSDKNTQSELLVVMSNNELKSIQGGGEYIVVKNEKGEWELHYFGR